MAARFWAQVWLREGGRVTHRDDCHDSQCPKGANEDDALVFFQGEEDRQEESLVAQLREEDEEEPLYQPLSEGAVPHQTWTELRSQHHHNPGPCDSAVGYRGSQDWSSDTSFAYLLRRAYRR